METNHFGTSPFIAIRHEGVDMPSTHTSRGLKQDRARVAGGQDHEVRYESKKSGKSAGRVKAAVKKVGNSRKKVERELRRGP
jgi:hypothetical protein